MVGRRSRYSPIWRTRCAVGDREIPYSLVTAIDLRRSLASSAPSADGVDPIVLNEWAASELGAEVGDPVTMEYYVWEEPGQLATRTTEFRVAAIVPIDAGDRDLAPAYPGISDSPSLRDWDPPFPVDLRRIRPVDEAYWNVSSDHAEGVRAAGGRPASLAVAVWRDHLHSRARRLRVDSLEETRGRDRASACVRRIDPLARGLGGARRARPRAWRRPGAPRTSASTSSTSASSWSCRRCCWSRCSSSSAWNSARARWDCCAPSGSVPAAVRRLFLARRAAAGGRRQRPRGPRRHCIRVADHDRARDVVGRCRRHDGADAARVVDLARRRRRRGHRGGGRPASGGRCAVSARISERSLLAGQI